VLRKNHQQYDYNSWTARPSSAVQFTSRTHARTPQSRKIGDELQATANDGGSAPTASDSRDTPCPTARERLESDLPQEHRCMATRDITDFRSYWPLHPSIPMHGCLGLLHAGRESAVLVIGCFRQYQVLSRRERTRRWAGSWATSVGGFAFSWSLSMWMPSCPPSSHLCSLPRLADTGRERGLATAGISLPARDWIPGMGVRLLHQRLRPLGPFQQSPMASDEEATTTPGRVFVTPPCRC
jgi:hypothetical protein